MAILLFNDDPIRRIGSEHPDYHLDRHSVGLPWRQTASNNFIAITTTKPARESSLVQEQRTRSTVWHSPSVSGLTFAISRCPPELRARVRAATRHGSVATTRLDD